MDPAELASHLEGQDVVLSALGAPGVHFFKIKFYLESIQSVVNAMRKAKLTRLICITAFYTKRNIFCKIIYEKHLKLNFNSFDN